LIVRLDDYRLFAAGADPRQNSGRQTMGKLLILLAVSTVLAYFSQQNTVLCYHTGTPYRPSRDWAYVALVTLLVFFAGLRYEWNDTGNYIGIFRNAPFLMEYLQGETIRDVFANPLFYLLISGFKSFFNNEYAFLFVTSCFTQCCFLWFIKRYSANFIFSVFCTSRWAPSALPWPL